MIRLYHELLEAASLTRAASPALVYRGKATSYASLREGMESVAAGMRGLGLLKGGRVAVYLPKQLQ